MALRKKSRACFRLAFTLVVVALAAVNASAQELRIAAAADLKFGLNDLAEQFEKQTQTKVDVTYGSSGNFFSQIQNGAPFDLFLSADISYPKKLETAGAGEPESLYEYAVGQIVIWMRPDVKLNLRSLGWSALLEATVKKIAIANPEHAPYGRAAVEALQKAGIYERVKAKLVYGENISQAAQFAQSGNAQAGILARSLALSQGMKEGQIWEIPAETHAPIEQAAIVLKAAKNKQAAERFLEFMKSEAGQRILEEHGFSIPSSAYPGAAHR
jgi:molybdate transport system substrate-binding protein